MTCDEMRTLVTTKNVSQTTRAERIAAINHVWRCRDCREWWDATPEDDGRELSDAELEAMAFADRRDPESEAP